MRYRYVLHRPLPRLAGFVALLALLNLFFHDGPPPIMTLVLTVLLTTAILYGISHWRWLIESYRISNTGIHVMRSVGKGRFIPFSTIRRADRIDVQSFMIGKQEILLLHPVENEPRLRIDLPGLNDPAGLLAAVERHVRINHLDRYGREVE